MRKRSDVTDSMNTIVRRIGLLMMILLVFLTLGSVLFSVLEGTSLLQGLINTLKALAFIYEASSAGAQAVQVFITVVGAVIFWWVVWSLFDIITSEHFVEVVYSKFVEWRIMQMKDHIIIAGGGRVGSEVAHRLAHKKVQFLVIESDIKQIRDLRKQGIKVILGDAEDVGILAKANIKTAKAILLTLPEAEKNLLVTLIAKELNPQILIHARADSDVFIPLLKKAGVLTAVIPEVAAADQLLSSLLN